MVVARALARLHFAPNGSARGLSVDTAAIDAARFMYAPNAIVDGVARSADVLVIRSEPIDPMTLAEAAPEEAVRAPEFDARQNDAAPLTGFERAVAAFNAVHPLDIPKSSGPCPACGHDGCFGRLAGDPGRWSCFSASHEKDSGSCGLHGPTCWHGDALDLAAHAARLSRGSLLRRDGFLVDPAVPRAGAQPGQTPTTHDREAEVALLASFLKDFAATSAACRSVGGVSASDFFDESTRRTYLAMLAIEGRRGRPDELSVRIELAGRGGPDALVDTVAARETVAVENAPMLAKRVRDLAKARADRAVFDEIRRHVEHGGATALAAIEAACVRQRNEFAPSSGAASAWDWQSPAEILASVEATTDWLVPNMIARQHVTVFYAKPKVGKTDTVVAGILAPLSRGESVFGYPKPAAPVLAVILSEETTGRWRSHVERFDLRDGRILTRGKIPSGVSFAEAVDAAARFAVSVGAAIVVVDTLTAFAGLAGDAENDAGKMGEALDPVLRAAAEHNVAFVLIHHVRKWTNDSDPADVDLLRGSGNFAAKVDFLVHVTKPSSAKDKFRRRELHVTGRLDCEPYSITIEKVLGPPDRYRLLGAEEAESDPELESAILTALASEPLQATDLAKDTERRKADVLRQLKSMAERGLVRCLAKKERPPGMKGKVYALASFRLDVDPSSEGASDPSAGDVR